MNASALFGTQEPEISRNGSSKEAEHDFLRQLITPHEAHRCFVVLEHFLCFINTWARVDTIIWIRVRSKSETVAKT